MWDVIILCPYLSTFIELNVKVGKLRGFYLVFAYIQDDMRKKVGLSFAPQRTSPSNATYSYLCLGSVCSTIYSQRVQRRVVNVD